MSFRDEKQSRVDVSYNTNFKSIVFSGRNKTEKSPQEVNRHMHLSVSSLEVPDRLPIIIKALNSHITRKRRHRSTSGTKNQCELCKKGRFVETERVQ